MDTNLMPKNADLFYCNCCDVKCYKQSNYTTHLLTSKHIKRYKYDTKRYKYDTKNADQKIHL